MTKLQVWLALFEFEFSGCHIQTAYRKTPYVGSNLVELVKQMKDILTYQWSHET